MQNHIANNLQTVIYDIVPSAVVTEPAMCLERGINALSLSEGLAEKVSYDEGFGGNLSDKNDVTQVVAHFEIFRGLCMLPDGLINRKSAGSWTEP